MGFFSFLNRDKNQFLTTADNGVLGPIYFDQFTEPINNPKKLKSFEWRRKLCLPNGDSIFKIKYFGKPHPNYKNIIIDTDYLPLLVIAHNETNNQEIILFDGCNHGNPLFLNFYNPSEINERTANKLYSNQFGDDKFEITISAFYSFDYQEEMSEEIDNEGFFHLSGKKISLNELTRNGFDQLNIDLESLSGNTTNLICAEIK